MSLDTAAVGRWFEDYLEVFAACARGDRPLDELLARYAVPLTVTTDDGAVTLATADQLAAMMQGQLDGLRAQGYRRTTGLSAEVSVLNGASALYRGSFIRHDADGAELGRPVVTYLLIESDAGMQIAVMASQGE
jgi:hypothetical protein